MHEPVRIAYDRPRGCPVTKKKKVKNSSGLPLRSENQLSLQETASEKVSLS